MSILITLIPTAHTGVGDLAVSVKSLQLRKALDNAMASSPLQNISILVMTIFKTSLSQNELMFTTRKIYGVNYLFFRNFVCN
ncbi:hypothetical protein CEXT_104621 [Caerostris extrusa]|uniref:Uncharacterized protein n=1 Tax=Caerostris extrusa TaxID=172846 RepID=A0AAV4QST1_CAEEX|nr:hypothetical protein CEXT_104621 [Caerostris extrusa]